MNQQSVLSKTNKSPTPPTNKQLSIPVVLKPANKGMHFGNVKFGKDGCGY